MKLHQVLRFIRSDIGIALFDISGNMLIFDNKSLIPIDLYEEDIFQITASNVIINSKAVICIMLQK